MKNKKIILIIGLAGSGKSTLAKSLSKKLNATWLNADKVRSRFNDWDFSKKGILRQSRRMYELANSINEKYVVADFVCPYKDGRKIFKYDYLIWMDTIKKSRFKKKKIRKNFSKTTKI